MNLHNTAPYNMEYIQKVFLGVQVYMQQNHVMEELIAFLDAEPPMFRSVAYESASMEMALLELRNGKALDNWTKFYRRSAKAHTFHMYIGLGWAFAKTEISPKLYLEFLQPPMRLMVYDGIGYYCGLFKGRKTVKSQLIPHGIKGKELNGFDQGLGRRLWYISKGEVNELVQLIQTFHKSRHNCMWLGVGIACGYVGGCGKEHLEQLLICSAGFNKQLCGGIALAAISRKASNSVSYDIDLACNIICGQPLEGILSDSAAIEKKIASELEITI
ncbi:MAG: DUF1702 family protein [Ginsengibacter sp.]